MSRDRVGPARVNRLESRVPMANGGGIFVTWKIPVVPRLLDAFRNARSQSVTSRADIYNDVREETYGPSLIVSSQRFVCRNLGVVGHAQSLARGLAICTRDSSV